MGSSPTKLDDREAGVVAAGKKGAAGRRSTEALEAVVALAGPAGAAHARLPALSGALPSSASSTQEADRREDTEVMEARDVSSRPAWAWA